MGVGLWHPDAPTLKRMREQVAADPAAWLAAVEGRRFQERFTVAGDRLQARAPGLSGRPCAGRGAEAEGLHRPVPPAPGPGHRATGFLEEFAGAVRGGAPLVRFICGALGQPY